MHASHHDSLEVNMIKHSSCGRRLIVDLKPLWRETCQTSVVCQLPASAPTTRVEVAPTPDVERPLPLRAGTTAGA